MNPNCQSNLKEYLKDYLYHLNFNQMTLCLNTETVKPSVEENSNSQSVNSDELEFKNGKSNELYFPD